jgi:hypothetical protein
VSVGGRWRGRRWVRFLRAATEMREHGTFSFARDAISYGELSAMFEEVSSG